MKRLTKFLRSQLMLMKPFLSNCSLATARKGQDRLGKLMAATHKNAVITEDFDLGAFSCSMITPKDEVSTGVILYLHGGGFTAGNLAYAKGFGTILSAKCGVRVLCAAYRIAPENIYPAALQDAMSFSWGVVHHLVFCENNVWNLPMGERTNPAMTT